MKKSFFLLFSAGILFSVSAKSQSLSSPIGGSTDNSMITPLVGDYNVTLVVSDSKGNPVSGAKVTLPCTGEPYELTDAKGTAVFTGSGSCPCTDAPVNVTTSKSNVNQYVYCGTNNVTLPQ